MDNLVFDLDNDVAAGSGMHKHLSVYEDRIELRASGSAFTNGLQGEKTIYYSDCTGVQFRLPTFLMAGYVQFETASGTNQANVYTSENSIAVRKSQNEVMSKIVEYVKDQIKKAKSNSGRTIVNAASSSADELKKFKELLDLGVITQEEFDTKKKQLLGL